MTNPSSDQPKTESQEPAKQYQKLLKGEISSKQFVKTLRTSGRQNRSTSRSSRSANA